ncbi:MAG: capsular biosynthesis protein [Anaerocolumna sp.]|jgi:UDP-2-acetamido-2,6-beta-L-arabino-hexul-4-ose reductase|nr:capsular biosynthesis protein [Anaerocolumna sp.]
MLIEHAKIVSCKLYLYQLDNIFGKWDTPTEEFIINRYCYDISHSIDVNIDSRDDILECCFIDDVIDSLLKQLNLLEQSRVKKLDDSILKTMNSFTDTDVLEQEQVLHVNIEPKYVIHRNELISKIQSVHQMRKNDEIPDISDLFLYRLYNTYLYYLPCEDLINTINTINTNESFYDSRTEILKTSYHDHFYIERIKPGMKKGDCWHNLRTEKWIVLSGKALVQIRRNDTEKIFNFYISQNPLKTMDIPVGYTHSIRNIGDDDLIVLVWTNANYEFEITDTYSVSVEI